MRILVYTSLYPCSANPLHGIFVNELVDSLARVAQVMVMAPEDGIQRLLAYSPRVGKTAQKGEAVLRCRYWHIPKIFKSLDFRFMAWSSRKVFQQALAFRPDLVHAHYAYPDGAAAAVLAARAGLPLVITCHGSDINMLARSPSRRRPIAWGLRQAASVVAVSHDLAEKIANLGIPASRIRHIPNGVDLSRFSLGDKFQARAALGLLADVPWLVAAGRLEPVKGYDRLLRAVARLENVHLLLVGDGGQRPNLERLSRELDISDRVRFVGRVGRDGLSVYYQAADALVLSSHSEGWPTVIHEALACGRPVVAPAVGGIPEALADPNLGLLLASAEPDILAAGIRRTLASHWEPAVLRQAAMAHAWDNVAARHLGLYSEALKRVTPPQQEEARNHGY